MYNYVNVIREVCDHLADGSATDAASMLRRDYPYIPKKPVIRKYGEEQLIRVFVRDGFLDRYTGDRLVFPPALRVLSIVLPEEFPYHPNWKTERTHPAFWELAATLDHKIPVTRGGEDKEGNWVTTCTFQEPAEVRRRA